MHKSVAPRNLTTKIQRVSKAIVSSSPKIEIFFSHLQSASLPADLNSKKMENPLLISNSSLWKNGPEEYFQTNPPANWFLKITCNNMEWQTPVADPKMTTSLFCSCDLSPDFCGPDDAPSYCPTCSTTSFHCSDLFNHIEGFSTQPPSPESGIKPQLASSCAPPSPDRGIKPQLASSCAPPPPSKEEIQPMDSAVYRRLFRFSSLQKIVRIVAIHQYMTKLMKEETLTLQNSIMLLQPRYLKLLRSYKPNSQEMSSAF